MSDFPEVFEKPVKTTKRGKKMNAGGLSWDFRIKHEYKVTR